ncbi:MAG: hypothetical protein ACJAVR_000749 [Paracoccaceae bacterium]|jgi:uncharacterized protein (UPF0335 family)
MADDVTDDASNATVHASQLRSIIERIERLEEEKKEVAEQIKEVYGEAKGNGFDTKILRKVISLRKKSSDERSEEEAMLDLYLQALGMLPG